MIGLPDGLAFVRRMGVPPALIRRARAAIDRERQGRRPTRFEWRMQRAAAETRPGVLAGGTSSPAGLD